MNKIKFCKMWDKLCGNNFKVGVSFTTARKYSRSKFDWYSQGWGTVWDVLLGTKRIGTAKLVSVTVASSISLSDSFIKKDTYANWTKKEFADLLQKFYGKRLVHLIILRFKVVGVQ